MSTILEVFIEQCKCQFWASHQYNVKTNAKFSSSLTENNTWRWSSKFWLTSEMSVNWSPYFLPNALVIISRYSKYSMMHLCIKPNTYFVTWLFLHFNVNFFHRALIFTIYPLSSPLTDLVLCSAEDYRYCVRDESIFTAHLPEPGRTQCSMAAPSILTNGWWFFFFVFFIRE